MKKNINRGGEMSFRGYRCVVVMDKDKNARSDRLGAGETNELVGSWGMMWVIICVVLVCTRS